MWQSLKHLPKSWVSRYVCVPCLEEEGGFFMVTELTD